MLSINTNKNNSNMTLLHIIIFTIIFFTGIKNSQDYLNLMGLTSAVSIISMLLYILVFSFCYYLIIKNLLLKQSFHINYFPYWIILLFAIIFKFFILFIQSPLSIFPGGNNYDVLIVIALNLTLMILFSIVIRNVGTLKVAIWALGLGGLISAVIPILFYPEMIGSRSGEINGISFVGGFWNSSVTAFISVGWILIALASIEKSKIKRITLTIIFLMLIFGGIAGLSRAILVSILLSVFVYLIASNKFLKYIRVIVVLLLSSLILIAIFPELVSNFGERLDGGLQLEDEPRTYIWKDYLEDFGDYFLFGDIEGDHRKYSNTNHGPHSVILNWLVQYGVLGLAGFILLIIGFIISIRKIERNFSKETSAALYAWIVSYLAVSVINETGFSQIPVYVAFGIIIAWGNIEHKTDAVKPTD